MKKLKITHILFMFLLMIPLMVNASNNLDDLKLKWTQQYTENTEGKGLVKNDTYYTFIGNTIKKINLATAKEKELTLEGRIDGYVLRNNQIMILTRTFDKSEKDPDINWKYHFYYISKFYVLDDNLNIIKKIELDSTTNYYYDLFEVDGKIYTYKNEIGTFTIDEEFNFTEVEENNSILNNQYELVREFTNIIINKYPNSSVGINEVVTTPDNKYLFTAYIVDDLEGDKQYTNDNHIVLIGYFDSDKKEILTKEIYQAEIKENSAIACGYNNSIEIHGEYIFTTFLDVDRKVYFHIYDKKGNLVKELDIDSQINGLIPSHIIPTDNGLIVILETNIYECNPTMEITGINEPSLLLESEPSDKTYMLYYEYPFEITIKEEGNGKIEASHTKNWSGEKITFKVTPEEGYVLGMINVTDENGNIVTFTDYTFTMPSANVTIEAVFVPENPDTADIAIIAIISVVILGSIGIIYSIKKLSWLK